MRPRSGSRSGPPASPTASRAMAPSSESTNRMPRRLEAAQKGPAARRRPAVRVERRPVPSRDEGWVDSAREAYSLYVERAAEGAPTRILPNDADGPFSAACQEER